MPVGPAHENGPEPFQDAKEAARTSVRRLSARGVGVGPVVGWSERNRNRLTDVYASSTSLSCLAIWLVGGNQVGKAAITGWRDLITPAVERDPALSLWPFDGRLAALLARPGVVIAETYPGEAYGHLDLTICKPDRSKRRQADRMADRHALRNWARTNHVLLADRLQASIDSGFGADAAGEDCFDAVVGLFGMLDVVLGNRPAGEPEDDVTKIEGWILGQQAPKAAATGPGRRRPTAYGEYRPDLCGNTR